MYKYLCLTMVALSVGCYNVMAMETSSNNNDELRHRPTVLRNTKPPVLKEEELNDSNSVDFIRFEAHDLMESYGLKVYSQTNSRGDLIIDYYRTLNSESGWWPWFLNSASGWANYLKLWPLNVNKKQMMQMILGAVEPEYQYKPYTSGAGPLTQGWNMAAIWGPKPSYILSKLEEKGIKKVLFVYPEWMGDTPTFEGNDILNGCKEFEKSIQIGFMKTMKTMKNN